MLKKLFAKWGLVLSIASIVAIALHFLIKLVSTSAVPLQFLANLPLWLVIVFGGVPLLAKIISKAFKLDLGADLLAAIALVTAVYLEQYIAANLIVLMLASGAYLEQYATAKASFVLQALAARMPSKVHLKVDGVTKEVDLSQIKIGDLIEIYPHETCPVDGFIEEGHGSMDESYLTGEPYQIDKVKGSTVLSGAINGESLLLIRASKIAQDSRYAKIMEVMRDAEQKRPQIRRLADRIGAIFAPLALIFALATLYFTGDIMRFLAVLVVATPCPLLIAIPITIISAISISARRGIIIKDPGVLEMLPTCSTAIFDKTGTLTYGRAELSQINAFGQFSQEQIFQMAASVSHYSRHPLSVAINKKATEEKLQLLAVENITEKPGQGLRADVDSRKIIVTSRKKFIEAFPEQQEQLAAPSHGLECLIVIDNKLAATFNFRDEPRKEGKSFINHLTPNHHFKKIMLVSGDRASEVNYLAGLFGIENTYASQTPEQKLAIVRAETAKAPTLFMGDGINDAPALTAATVGIAFGENTGVTSEAAGAVIMENSLIKVDELIHISEDMRKIALQSAVLGMGLSFLGMILAALGMISPISGALLQEAIDVAAILNSLRLTWREQITSDIDFKS